MICAIVKQDYRLVLWPSDLVNGRTLNHDRSSMSTPPSPPTRSGWMRAQEDVALEPSRGWERGGGVAAYTHIHPIDQMLPELRMEIF
jgi:hypothetical protein